MSYDTFVLLTTVIESLFSHCEVNKSLKETSILGGAEDI